MEITRKNSYPIVVASAGVLMATYVIGHVIGRSAGEEQERQAIYQELKTEASDLREQAIYGFPTAEEQQTQLNKALTLDNFAKHLIPDTTKDSSRKR